MAASARNRLPSVARPLHDRGSWTGNGTRIRLPPRRRGDPHTSPIHTRTGLAGEENSMPPSDSRRSGCLPRRLRGAAFEAPRGHRVSGLGDAPKSGRAVPTPDHPLDVSRSARAPARTPARRCLGWATVPTKRCRRLARSAARAIAWASAAGPLPITAAPMRRKLLGEIEWQWALPQQPQGRLAKNPPHEQVLGAVARHDDIRLPRFRVRQ